MIKHLVLSGGGIWGLSCYGALRESSKADYWNINNIESIYATSVGSILAIMLALKYDWETMDDFLIKRPWNQIFHFNIYSIMSSVEKCGIFDEKCIYSMFDPLFKGKDISLDITLKEFYELTNIELNFFSTEINVANLSKINFSHKTHPDWKILDAVYCSCSLPFLFRPFFEKCPTLGEDTIEKCYIDGGILNNYPWIDCLTEKQNGDEIFGIKKGEIQNLDKIKSNASLFDYMLYIIIKVIGIMSLNEMVLAPPLKNELEIKSNTFNIYEVYSTASSMEERIKLINYGGECWTRHE
jgi:predicted acylesterase/phospholipase RssA